MPHSLTSPTPGMTFAPPPRPTIGKRALIAGAVLVAAIGAAFWASAHLPATTPGGGMEKATQNNAGLDKAAIEKLDLSQFQKRGTVLVGETVTPAGVRLRLVLDARTHALVGMRVIDKEGTSAP